MLLLITKIASSSPLTTPRQVKIEGTLQEKGSRKPLPQINIYCFSSLQSEKPLQVSTDSFGKFSLEVPEGKLKWIISASQYLRFEHEEEQYAEKENSARHFYLEKSSYLNYETTIYGGSQTRDDQTKSLKRSEFLTVPGANGDPVKAVQNLPGVNRSSSFSSQVIIEGSSPNDTRYNIENQNVPLIFHFLGITSVVLPEAVDHVDYLPAGFGPEYAQSTAGLVNLTLKDPETDRLHGFAFLDLINTGGKIEGPINDHSSFLVDFRQSYIGSIFGAVVGKNNSNFNLTAVPEFQDTAIEYKNDISKTDHFKIIGIGSRDQLGFLLSKPVGENPVLRGNLNYQTDFFRIIPEWTHQFQPELIGRCSFGVGKDWSRFNIGELYSNKMNTALTGRIEIEDQLNPAWKSYWGIETQLYWYNIQFQTSYSYNQGGVSTPLGTASTVTVDNQYSSNAMGLYWRNVIHPPDSPWTLTPGFRLSYFNLTQEIMPEPRVSARYEFGNGWATRAASGFYDQAPPIQYLDTTYGNPNLKSQRGIHASWGIEKDFRHGSGSRFTITQDLFYKYIYSIAVNSPSLASPTQPLYYDNSGYGHIYGFEFLGKYKSSTWESWISYTLSRSNLGNAQIPEALSPYDQTHLLTAVSALEVGRNWKISTRMRYTTGNPYTPITSSILDVNNNTYVPQAGTLYSLRMPAFFQWDVRIDKKWIYNKWILTAYLDIENLTNQSNPQQMNYSYNYQQSETVTGLPIFPTLGMKAEF